MIACSSYISDEWAYGVSVMCSVQLSAYEDDAVIAGYVLSQEGPKKWNKMWYQVKSDCVLYKFKAHEVSICAWGLHM